MAEGADEESKTEDPSPRRVSQAYEEGNIPIGRDAVAVAGLAGGVAALIAFAVPLRDALSALFATSLRGVAEPNFRDLAILAWPLAVRGAGVVAAIALAAIVATLLQTQLGLWTEKIIPDFERLMGFSKVFRPFTREFAIDFGMTLLKVAVIVWAGWSSLRSDFAGMVRLFELPVGGLLPALFEPMSRALVRMLAALGAVAAGDFFLQRWRFDKQMRMTKEEAKREWKEEEGDPTMKGRRRRKAREMLKQRARQEVPRADVLVVNPTHLAIAIRYRKDEGASPRVIAKGEGPLAQLMRDLARDHAVPIVQDVPLARLLYKRVKVGQGVPEQTYRAVAAILVFVYKLTGRRPE